MLKRLLPTLLLSILSTAGLSLSYQVFEDHPRLFFRDNAWGERSITTDILRKRARDSRYSRFLERMTRRGSCNWALKAVMLDDTDAALECIEML